MKSFNKWLAKKITDGVATMWCAYGFAVIAIYGYPYGSHDPKVIIQWFAQEFLQLVLLSIILVGQKISQDKHKDTLKHLRRISKHLNIEEK
jgi:hypothetical protein